MANVTVHQPIIMSKYANNWDSDSFGMHKSVTWTIWTPERPVKKYQATIEIPSPTLEQDVMPWLDSVARQMYEIDPSNTIVSVTPPHRGWGYIKFAKKIAATGSKSIKFRATRFYE